MKKGIIALTLALMLVFSGSVMAYEFVGGAIYTTFELDELNSEIESFNTQMNDLGINEKMDKLDSSFGFYGGVRFNTSEKTSIDLTYEKYSPNTGVDINYTDATNGIDLDIGMDMNLDINGLVVTGKNKINDIFNLNAGAGYYFGTAKITSEFSGTDGVGTIDESEEVTEDYSGFGFKVGAGVDYELEGNSSLYADLNYRILELDAEDTDTTVNANGIELKGGLSYKF